MTDPVKTEPRRWSFSALDEYQSCGEKFRLKRIDRVPSLVWLNASAGTAFHKWAEDYDYAMLDQLEGPSPWDYCLDKAIKNDETKSGFAMEQFGISGRGKETYEYWRDELGPELCAKYIAWRDKSEYTIATSLPPDRDGKTVGIEYAVECLIGSTHYLGYIDRAFVDAQGNIILVDLKAGARKQTTLQLPSYLVAATKSAVNATAAAIYYARKGELTEPQSFPNYNEKNLALVYDTVRKQEARGEYAPRPSADCGWCSVRNYCKFRLK